MDLEEPSDGPRPRMTVSERQNVMQRLDEILVRAEIVRDELYVVARRENTHPSSWSSEQLDGLCAAARRLQRATEKTPVATEY